MNDLQNLPPSVLLAQLQEMLVEKTRGRITWEGLHIEIRGLKKGQKKREFRELWIAFEPVFRNHLDPFMVSC